MSTPSRRRVLGAGMFGVACACVAPRFAYAYADSPTGKYMCPPCGCSADGKTFDAAGDCPACGMPLVAKPAEPPKGPDSPPTPKASDETFAASAERR